MPFVDPTPLGDPKSLRQTIALLNFGGPESEQAVEPFLYSLFDDPAVIRLPGGATLQHRFASLISRRRAPKAAAQYREIGFSPLVRTTEAQAEALRALLGPNSPVLVGMRYTEPSIAKLVADLAKNRPDRIVALALFPHFSATTTGSAYDLLSDELHAQGLGQIPIHYIPAFHDHPSYLRAMTGLVESKIGSMDRSRLHLLFSAHGLPSSYYRSGDPYPTQIHESVRLLVRSLAWVGRYSLAFQSRVGPVRWLGPSTEEELDRLASEGATKDVVVVPLSFTTEGIETLYEIDVTCRHHAEPRGHGGYSPGLHPLPRGPDRASALGRFVPGLGCAQVRALPPAKAPRASHEGELSGLRISDAASLAAAGSGQMICRLSPPRGEPLIHPTQTKDFLHALRGPSGLASGQQGAGFGCGSAALWTGPALDGEVDLVISRRALSGLGPDSAGQPNAARCPLPSG